MKRLLFTAALATCVLAAPAYARLQIAISDGVNLFTCFDGQGCDASAGANNTLQTGNITVGNFSVFGTFSTSSFGGQNNLDISSFGVINNGLTQGTIKVFVSDTGFIGPVSSINESGSLTFHNNVGAGNSKLQFWADPNNVQGANPTNTPGTLLFTALGTALTNPDSFAGTQSNAISLDTPFSMTVGASIDLLGKNPITHLGGSITGFNQDMLTVPVPEMKTWTMAAVGFGLLGLIGLRKRRENRAIA